MPVVNFIVPLDGLAIGNGNITIDTANTALIVGNNTQGHPLNYNSVNQGGNIVIQSNNRATSNNFATSTSSLRVNGGGYIRGNLVIGGSVNFDNYPPANVTTIQYNANAGTTASAALTIRPGDFFVSAGNQGATLTPNLAPFSTITDVSLILVTGVGGSGSATSSNPPAGTYRFLGTHSANYVGLWKRIA